MNRTEAEWVVAMQAMAKALQLDPAISVASVDDWGRFGNFTLHVTPRSIDRGTTRRLRTAVGKKLPVGSQIRDVFGPDPLYVRTVEGRVRAGWSRRFWVFDIDFIVYDGSSNLFRGQKCDEALAG